MEAITREEKFMAKILGEDVGELTPITRTEKFLDEIAKSGGGGGGVSSWNDLKGVIPAEKLPEGYGYKESATKTIFEGPVEGYEPFAALIEGKELLFVAGETYVITYQGKEYECVAEEAIYEGQKLGYVGIGNGSMSILPFVGNPNAPVAIYPNGVGDTVVSTNDIKFGTGEFINIKVEQKATIKKFDSILMPEGYPYVGESVVTILEETNLTVTNSQGTMEIPRAFDLVVGKTYIVTWDGVRYPCVCFEIDLSDLGLPGVAKALGNTAAAGGANTGEPFALATFFEYGASVVMPLTGATSATVKIEGKGEVIHKMDAKFLPESAVTKDYVEELILGAMEASY